MSLLFLLVVFNFNFLKKTKPDFVILAAAKVGGIVANNTYRADFIYENLMIQNNVIHQAYVHGVQKLLFLGFNNSTQPTCTPCAFTRTQNFISVSVNQVFA